MQQLLDALGVDYTTPQAKLYLEKERRALILAYSDGIAEHQACVDDAYAHGMVIGSVEPTSGNQYFEQKYNTNDQKTN